MVLRRARAESIRAGKAKSFPTKPYIWPQLYPLLSSSFTTLQTGAVHICRKCGQQYANQLRRRRPRPGDKWHLDEMMLTINGERHYLWRAVDQDGTVLDILVQCRRNKRAAMKFLRKLLKGLTYVPRVIVTDKLKSYGAAKRELLSSVEHRQHRYLNNRAENSHQPTRQRERRMQRFKSPGQAQRFLSASGPIAQHFRPRRYRLSASVYRPELGKRSDLAGDYASSPGCLWEYIGENSSLFLWCGIRANKLTMPSIVIALKF